MKTRKTKMQNQNNESTSQQIQERAYELFLKRGGQPGHELEDWLQAEREIQPEQEQHVHEREVL